MKIAFLMHPVSSGGISRFQRLLISALVNNYLDINIDVVAGEDVIKRDRLFKLSSKNVKIISLESLGSKNINLDKINEVKKRNTLSFALRRFLKKSNLLNKLYFFIKNDIFRKDIPWYKYELGKNAISTLKNYDLVYLPSPFFIKPFSLSRPIVSTVHDYNWKHDFEGNFNKEMLDILDSQMNEWFNIFKTAISSTNFIDKEQKKYYPGARCLRRVVYLSTFNKSISNKRSTEKVRKKFGLDNDYIIYPGRIAKHKNILNLIKAFSLLQEDESFKYPLAFSGLQSDSVSYKYKKLPTDSHIREINKFLSESNLKLGKDIIPLGYVSDEEIDALIKGAFLVVSTSLYEAGSGPGLDAWNAGTPVAFSNIPPHLEQLDFLRTKAWTFDPKDPEDIAKVIKQALDNPEKSKQMAKESKEAIDKYTWDDVAEGYYKVFKEAIEK